jgi:hypothetical protein
MAALQVVSAGAGKAVRVNPNDFVAIPLLPVKAATPGEHGDQIADLGQLKPDALWAAPAAWCPNPASTISLRVRGNSMSPLILDGYVIAVDTSEAAPEKLAGRIVVAWSRKTKQLVVSRLIRFDHTYALISDQRENQSVVIARESEWRIVGKVLWWMGKACY